MFCKRKKFMVFFSFFNITLVMRKLKGSHIKLWYFLGTYYWNIWKIVTKPKSKRKCSNMIFNFFCKSNDFFLQKKSDKIFPFHIYFSHLCKISNQKKKKKLVMTCVFENFQSHCQIFNNEFLHISIPWSYYTQYPCLARHRQIKGNI